MSWVKDKWKKAVGAYDDVSARRHEARLQSTNREIEVTKAKNNLHRVRGGVEELSQTQPYTGTTGAFGAIAKAPQNMIALAIGGAILLFMLFRKGF